MRQTELLNIQEAISFEGYDRWVTMNRDEDDSHRPAYRYIRDICEESGYEPTGSDIIHTLAYPLWQRRMLLASWQPCMRT
jgi:hypothetical protein